MNQSSLSRSGRRGLTCGALILIISALGAMSAQAASTRAEYIAQVEPICQTFGPQEIAANTTFTADYKRWLRLLKHGPLKNLFGQTTRTASALQVFNQVHAAMTDQVAAVPPVPADAATINLWLNDRRQADVFSVAAASSLAHFKIPQFRRQLNQANAADAAGVQALVGFGFQTCGVRA